MIKNPAGGKPGISDDITPKDFKNFVQVNLVANTAGSAVRIDANLVNAWDIGFPLTALHLLPQKAKGYLTGII